MRHHSLLVLLALPVSLAIHADSLGAQSRLRGTMRLGADFGGEKVLEFEYDDGTSPEVTAGGGVLFTVGGVFEAFPSARHGLDAQLSAGIKYRTIPPATNQEASWTRFPVEGLLFYRTPAGVRLGAGSMVHLRNVFSTSGEAANGRVEFRSKPGMLFQADYVRGSFGFDVRYTALEYEAEGGGTVDASSIGAGVSYFFGRK